MHSEPIRIYTAGNVDDGKSTLIGYLLYCTQSIPKDKWEEIETLSKRKNSDRVDLSLLTDGLIEERAKGITIDVAHIYFSTDKSQFILADTPGHKEFTRNMITGASFSDVAIIMIDAQKGIQEQTLRHAYITGLLNLGTVIFCVNKMDLMDYDKTIFDKIQSDFAPYLDIFHKQQVFWVPVSALWGENVGSPSPKMEWYQGKSLLDILENILPPKRESHFRLQIQQSVQISGQKTPFYTGIVTGGQISAGDEVSLFPSGETTTIEGLFQHGKPVSEVCQGMSVSLKLNTSRPLKRGEMIVQYPGMLTPGKTLSTILCWMDDLPLQKNVQYNLINGSAVTPATIEEILNEIDILRFGIKKAGTTLNTNDIAEVRITTEEFAGLQPFAESRNNGTFILVDPLSFHTVATGFVVSIT
ncbi:MAG: 50S ribosome-binding GTPase [Bacteroidia bacterium]|nr:50S ribosome-binding GTPase [Bacteroidia bacterium]